MAYKGRPGQRWGRPPAPPAQQVPLPPPGYYDPAIDAQQAAAGRGLFDLGQDVGTQDLRDTVDYGLGRDAIGRSRDRGIADLYGRRDATALSYGRGVEDINTGTQRGTEDYQRNVQALTRRYGQLGDSQRQQQSRAGVMRGGAMLQAAAKREANQAIDRQPMDTGFQRFQADQGQARTRLDQNRDVAFRDIQTAQDRLGQDSELQLGQLALMGAPPDASNPFGGRSFQDRTTQLTRAQRENTQYGLDANAQRVYQAAGAGWVPPPLPKRRAY